MVKLLWNLLDDEWFVYLVSDILKDSGYVVRHQGVGPDGGVDFFATQTISFAFDSHPFTWAVQCKFSVSPDKAVNDTEIKDVEGILRSSRFQSLRPNGYLLVTNRRITQNVIERLRGTNDQSPFRTCAIDGSRLTSLINVNERVFFKYFTDPSKHKESDYKNSERGKSSRDPVGELEAAIEGVTSEWRSHYLGFPELLIARRAIAKAERDWEIAVLRFEAYLEGGEDLEPSFKMRGRMARERLEQMGVSVTEERENEEPN